MKLKNKAQIAADTMPFYIVFGILVTGLFIVFILIVNNYSTKLVEVPEGLETYALYQRFFRSPDCFTYEDISGRSYPFLLDWDKFNQDQLSSCYVLTDNPRIPAFRLRLSFSEDAKNIQTENWNNDKGPEQAESPKQVFVYYKNKKYPGKLTIGIQNV